MYYSGMIMNNLMTTVNLTVKVCSYESAECKHGPAVLSWEFKRLIITPGFTYRVMFV